MALNGISALTTNTAVTSPEVAGTASKPVLPAQQAVIADKGINVTATKPIPPPSESDLKSALNAINRYLAPTSNDIQFVQDKDSGITLVQVVDTATGTVLRQIPTQQIVEISKDLAKLQGLLVKEKA